MELKLHEQIASLRRAKGVTQEELASVLGVTNQAVSKWESAQCCPDIQLLPEIADYFCVSIDKLMGRHTMNSRIEAAKKESDNSLLEKALAVAKEQGKASTSLLQRHLNIGYIKALYLLEKMAELGYIGPDYTALKDNLLDIKAFSN